MQVFQASDIVEIAVRIEENGVNFYRFAEQLAKQEEAKKELENIRHVKTIKFTIDKNNNYSDFERRCW